MNPILNAIPVSRWALQLAVFAAMGLVWQAPAHAKKAKQCVYNQAGYVAEVKWYADGDLKFEVPSNNKAKTGFKMKKASASVKPVKTQTITLGRESCIDVDGKPHWAVVRVKGGKIARVAAIIATDIGLATVTAGCWVGAAALTVATAGGGAVAGAGCEVVTDAAVGLMCEPDIIPDAKELAGVVAPPTNGKKAVFYGTVFDPKVRIGHVL